MSFHLWNIETELKNKFINYLLIFYNLIFFKGCFLLIVVLLIIFFTQYNNT